GAGCGAEGRGCGPDSVRHEGGGRRPAAGRPDGRGAAGVAVHHGGGGAGGEGRPGGLPPRDRGRLRGRGGAAARGGDGDEGEARAALPVAQGDHGGEEEAAGGEGGGGRRGADSRPGAELSAGAAARPHRGRRRGCGGRARASPQGRGEGAVMKNILAVAEQRDGSLRRVSQEAVSAARGLADALGAEVHALVLGPAGITDAAAELGRWGADRVRVVEHEAFALYNPDGYAQAVAAAAKDGGYFAVLFPASALGKDLAPRVAAKLDAPLATEATALAIEDGDLVVTRPVYAGKAFARVALDGEPRLVSLRPNVFQPAESPRDGTVEQLDVALDPSAWR